MLKVALYGGAGSGKSTAAELFVALGAPVIDADIIAKELTVAGSPQLEQIIAVWGPRIIKNNQLDRALLRHIIFSNAAARMRLNEIMHPPIRRELKARIDSTEAPYCIVVIPLLIETRMTDLVDYVVVVDCPMQMQIERIIARDGLSAYEAAKIVNAQATRKQRLDESDRVIDNSLDINHLKDQVYNLHKEWT
ncbi:MAG: dephospho-CoA kinase [Gammaproteobacteria bacterium]|nr:dephospho-CoA kinase [Gammaproteobacteria bacterium]